MDSSEKRILVTGAAGFVGSRLIERLFTSNKHAKIRVLIHNSSNITRLTKYPVELIYGDMASVDLVNAAMKGCDVVVHCAYGTPQKTISGTKNLLKCANEHNIDRFVHISSVAVHGIRANPNATINDQIPYKLTGHMYSDTKIITEKIANEYQKTTSLPIVILRPTNIFGPHSKTWTTTPIAMLKNRCYTLINGGKTPSNTVYVDNVIDSIEQSIQKDQAIGQILTITDETANSWKDFFSAYACMFKNPPKLYNLQFKEAKTRRHIQHTKYPQKILYKIQRYLSYLTFYGKSTRSFYLSRVYEKIRNRLPETAIFNEFPSQDLVNLFASKVHYSASNAQRYLEYTPQISFNEGMKLTEQWLKNNRLIN